MFTFLNKTSFYDVCYYCIVGYYQLNYTMVSIQVLEHILTLRVYQMEETLV